MNAPDEMPGTVCAAALALPDHPDPVARGAAHPRTAAKVGNLENQVLMTWSITNGIRRHGRDEAIYQTNDLLDALKHIDKTPQNGVYVHVRRASRLQGSGRRCG